MPRQDLQLRTKRFAIAVIKLCGVLPNRPEGWVLGKQLMRSGTSIGANYCESQRSRSDSEFYSKIHIVQQEIDETAYWLDLIRESELMPSGQVDGLLSEIRELRAIFGAIALSRRNRENSD